ncbi:MAG: NAD(P)(+) transhydrogenase (Re/Si-specific) subunit alpha, partial [Alphaproteobacteria bacterium]
MKVAVLKERRAGETRVAATPETVKKLIGMGCTLTVEAGAGLASGITDAAFSDAGAS